MPQDPGNIYNFGVFYILNVVLYRCEVELTAIQKISCSVSLSTEWWIEQAP